MYETGKIKITEHLEAIIGERNPFTSMEKLQETAGYIEDQFISLGLRIEKEDVPYRNISSQNILGYKDGSDGSDEYFIIAAHYDSVEGTPGADDNASAVAALLEVARMLEPIPLKTTLLYAGFTLEECGFIGSTQFAQRARQAGDRIEGMIALEMLGYRTSAPGSQTYPSYVDPARFPDKGDFIAVVGNEPSMNLTTAMAESIRQTVPQLPVEHLILPGRGDQFEEIRLSDHSPFWENGFRAVMITDTAFFRNPNYHQSTDTLETLDIEFIRDISTGIAGFLKTYLG